MRRMTQQKGVTLIELLIAMAILGILAAVAIPAYTKYTRRAKRAEVAQIFGEFQTKEEQYKTENGTYLSTGADESAIHPMPSGDRRTSVAPRPTSWNALRLATGTEALYCGYVAIAGSPDAEPDGTDGATLWNGKPVGSWFYLRAVCDWDSGSSALDEVHLLRGDHALTETVLTNEGR
jgi:prepilin-type N-terminal cleavage/methylation domain-containing protein